MKYPVTLPLIENHLNNKKKTQNKTKHTHKTRKFSKNSRMKQWWGNVKQVVNTLSYFSLYNFKSLFS